MKIHSGTGVGRTHTTTATCAALAGLLILAQTASAQGGPNPCPVPTISVHPESQTIAAGERATLSVTASSDTGLSLSYQWLRTTVSSSSIASHETDRGRDSTFQTPALDRTTSYRVTVMQVTGSCLGSIRSEIATVTVVHTPPVASLFMDTDLSGDRRAHRVHRYFNLPSGVSANVVAMGIRCWPQLG